MDFLLMAAGLGSRLKERTEAKPKALIELCGHPLLGYVLDRAQELPWVDRLIVVTGYQREMVVDYINQHPFSKPLREVFNPDFRLGNFYSLYRGLQEVGESWALMNVDHVYPRELYEKCWENRKPISAICDFDRPLLEDCMKVKLGSDGKSIAAISKTLTQYDGGYIGMTWIGPEGRSDYLDAVEMVKQWNNPNAYAEMALQTLATTGTPPSIVNASGFGWLEIDDENDLIKATQTLKKHPRFLEKGSVSA